MPAPHHAADGTGSPCCLLHTHARTHAYTHTGAVSGSGGQGSAGVTGMVQNISIALLPGTYTPEQQAAFFAKLGTAFYDAIVAVWYVKFKVRTYGVMGVTGSSRRLWGYRGCDGVTEVTVVTEKMVVHSGPSLFCFFPSVETAWN